MSSENSVDAARLPGPRNGALLVGGHRRNSSRSPGKSGVQRALVTPDAGHVVVKPEGDVTILPGSPIPEHPVIQAARLLKGLLRETPAPPDLRDLVTQNLGLPPSCAWIEEFVTALSYFERQVPDRSCERWRARATATGSRRPRSPRPSPLGDRAPEQSQHTGATACLTAATRPARFRGHSG